MTRQFGKTLRPMLEFLNMTCGGVTVAVLWGERDEALKRIIRIMCLEPGFIASVAIWIGDRSDR